LQPPSDSHSQRNSTRFHVVKVVETSRETSDVDLERIEQISEVETFIGCQNANWGDSKLPSHPTRKSNLNSVHFLEEHAEPPRDTRSSIMIGFYVSASCVTGKCATPEHEPQLVGDTTVNSRGK
jgi:hypothetical protein